MWWGSWNEKTTLRWKNKMCYNVKVASLTHLSGQVCASGVVMCCFEVNDNNVTPDSSIAWPARKWSWIGPWSATVGLFFSITSSAFVSLWPCAWSFSVLSWKTPLSSSHSLRDGFAVLACFLSSVRWFFLSRFLLKPNTVRDFSCKNHWILAAQALWDFYKIRKLSKICIMLLLIVAFYPLHIGAQGFKGLTWTGTCNGGFSNGEINRPAGISLANFWSTMLVCSDAETRVVGT